MRIQMIIEVTKESDQLPSESAILERLKKSCNDHIFNMEQKMFYVKVVSQHVLSEVEDESSG